MAGNPDAKIAALARHVDQIEDAVNTQASALRAHKQETRDMVAGRLAAMDAKLSDLAAARVETVALIAQYVRESK